MPSSLGIFRSVTTTSNRPAASCSQRLLAVGGRDHLVALRGQIVGQGDAFDLFVVDDKDSHGSGCGRRSSGHRRLAFVGRVQDDGEGGALAQDAADFDPAAHLGDQHAAQAQAQAGAAASRPGW